MIVSLLVLVDLRAAAVSRSFVLDNTIVYLLKILESLIVQDVAVHVGFTGTNG